MKSFPVKIVICGKDEIDAHAQSGLTHMLSIENPQTPKATPAWFKGDHRQLLFNDIESKEEARILNLIAPRKPHLQEILNYGREISFLPGGGARGMLVHCHAGICRSTEASYAIIAQYLGKGRAHQALELVLQVRPAALPNRLMVKFADELLGFDGELFQPLQKLRYPYNQLVNEWFAKGRAGNEDGFRK